MRILAEDLLIRLERNNRAAPVDCADILQFADGFAAFETHLVRLAIARDFHFHPFRQRVDDRRADAVQAAGCVIDFAAEFSARMQRGHDHFKRGFVLELRMRIDGNAAAIVADRQHIVLGQVPSRCVWRVPQPLRPSRCRGSRLRGDAAHAHPCRRYTCRACGERVPAPQEPRCPWRYSPWRARIRCRTDRVTWPFSFS